MQSIALTRHSTTPCKAVRHIEVQVYRKEATLEMRYVAEGDIDRLLIPAESESQRADQLWQHTCFEAFVMGDNLAGYYEFNFSPSTEWAIYRFSAYREGMTVIESQRPPRITVQREPDRLSLSASVDLEPFPVLRDSPGLRLGLCAVIEEAQPRLSYWALVHPAAKPDFHHADGFALTLPWGDASSPRGHAR